MNDFGYMIKIQGHNALMKVLTAFLPTGNHIMKKISTEGMLKENEVTKFDT